MLLATVVFGRIHYCIAAVGLLLARGALVPLLLLQSADYVVAFGYTGRVCAIPEAATGSENTGAGTQNGP